MSERRKPHPNVIAAACNWGILDVNAFPWEFIGFVGLHQRQMGMCIHTNVATFSMGRESQRLPELEKMYGDDMRVIESRMAPLPKPIEMARHDFMESCEALAYYVGQCPDCGKILWAIEQPRKFSLPILVEDNDIHFIQAPPAVAPP